MASNKAGQCKSGTHLTTATKMAMTNTILIDSHTISESNTAPANRVGRRVVPQAIKAVGTTTARTPYSADRHGALPEAHSPQSNTINTPMPI